MLGLLPEKEIHILPIGTGVENQKGAKRATIALARKILVVIFNMLKNLVLYDDSTYETLRLKCQKRKTDRFISELTKLGYQVVAPC